MLSYLISLTRKAGQSYFSDDNRIATMKSIPHKCFIPQFCGFGKRRGFKEK
jgi:hypothetical protein